MFQEINSSRAWLILLALALPARAGEPATPSLPELVGSPTVTRADCQRAVSALVAGRAAPASSGERTAFLRQRRIVRDDDDLTGPERKATRGYACLLFMRALGESGGVMTRLFGGSEHYAYRHLEYLALIPAGGAQRCISGAELVGLLSLSRKRLQNSKGRGSSTRK